MKFEDCLFNSFDAIYKRHQCQLKEQKDLIKVFESLHEAYLNFYLYIQSFTEIKVEFYTNETYRFAMNAFIEMIKHIVKEQKEYVKTIKMKVLEKLKKNKEIIEIKGNQLVAEYYKNEKLFSSSVEFLEKSKNFYFISAKQDLENNEKFDPKIKTNSEKLAKSRNQLIDSEIAYQIQLNNTNKLREVFIEKSKSILSEFQKMEENYITEMKKIFSKIISTNKSLCEHKLLNYLEIEKYFSDVKPLLDIDKFIEKHQTNQSVKYPEKFEFNYYPGIKTKIYSPRKRYVVIDKDLIEYDKVLKITNMIDSIWESKDENVEKFIDKTIISEKRFRKRIFTSLNYYRTQGIFNIKDNTYLALGKIFIIILNQIDQDYDYESFRLILILSQTYYKMGLNNKKIFLLDYIEDEKIFTNLKFWEEAIKFSIKNESSTYDDNLKESGIFESVKDQSERMYNLVFGQISSFLYNITHFKIPLDKIIDMLKRLADNYQVKEDIKQILTITAQESFKNYSQSNLEK